MILDVQNLQKRYGKTYALGTTGGKAQGVNIKVSEPGVISVLGANGAGKTTLISCALGLVRPTRGRVEIFGYRAGRMQARQRTGIMLQDADLPDQLTPREHISLFASYYPEPMSVEGIVSLCEISDFANKAYGKLSGGQKRRVQFALTLVGQPDLIFLDEPTTGLDPDARRVIWDVIRNLSNAGKTVILTTHYLEEADILSDRIIVMSEGEVIADAPTEQIRGQVGGAIIRCVTRLDDEYISRLPAMRSFTRAGRFIEVLTYNQTLTVRAFLEMDPDLSELTVTKPSLEEAFRDLIHKPSVENEGDVS